MKNRKLRPWVTALGCGVVCVMGIADIYIALLLCYCRGWS